MAQENSSMVGMNPRPIERKGWDKIKHFFYAPETGAVCSRTPKSWGLILLYYLIFYACLIAFWYALLQIYFAAFLKTDRPMWMDDESLIGDKPGIGVMPLGSNYETSSSLYVLHGDLSDDKEPSADVHTVKRIEDFLNNMNSSVGQYCNDTELSHYRSPQLRPCNFDVSSLGPCSEQPYGWGPEREPCFYITFNKILDYEPDPIEPSDLKNYLGVPEKIKKSILNAEGPRLIYISCEAMYGPEKESLEDALQYFPENQGIPLGYFPYQNIKDTTRPVVAVRIVKPIEEAMMHIQCKAWYKGVVHDPVVMVGMVSFEIYTVKP